MTPVSSKSEHIIEKVPANRFYCDGTYFKPKFRGVSHQYAFFVAAFLCSLMLAKTTSDQFWPILIYSFGLCGMLGTSACYHRINWTKKQELLIRKLDYTMIGVMIAGSFTPFCALALSSRFSTAALWIMWTGATLGLFVNVIWSNTPKKIRTALFIVLGFCGVPLLPEIISSCGSTCAALCFLGGAIHVLGGVVYAFQKPDPLPEIFGYHEIFHACVVIASAIHFYCVWTYVI